MSAAKATIERVFGDEDRPSGLGRAVGSGRSGRDRSAVVADLRRKLGSMGAGSGWPGDSGSGASDAGASVTRVAPGDTRNGSDFDDGVLAAPPPLAAVLPYGGVPRGSVVSVGSSAPGGGGATSLLLALLAASPGAWAAVVGMPDLGVLAAAEMGVDLTRLGIIPEPGPELLQVLSVLADGVDVIATAPPTGLPPARQRVLTGRLRQSGAVLLVAGRWPGADLVLTVQEVRWSGMGQGFGRLRDRELDVLVAGRRAGAALGTSVTLALRAGPRTVTVVAPESQSLEEITASPAAARAEVG